MKIFFPAVTRLILEKKHILAIFGIIFQKIDIISDIIIPIAAIFKNFFNILFVALQSMTLQFPIKKHFPIRIQDALPRGMIRQKYPGADRINYILKNFSHKF